MAGCRCALCYLIQPASPGGKTADGLRPRRLPMRFLQRKLFVGSSSKRASLRYTVLIAPCLLLQRNGAVVVGDTAPSARSRRLRSRRASLCECVCVCVHVCVCFLHSFGPSNMTISFIIYPYQQPASQPESTRFSSITPIAVN